MRSTNRAIVAVLIALLAATAAQAGDLQAGWYAKIVSLTAWPYSPGGPPPLYPGFFNGPDVGQYGPFAVTDGGHGIYERDVTVPANASGVDPSQSLILPISLSITWSPIAYVETAWQTDYDPTQMRLELWRSLPDGQQQMQWYQTRGGPKGGIDNLGYDYTFEGRYYFKVAVAPPEGFPDLSPPDITVQSPSETCYYKHDDESILISIVLKDYGTGISSADLILDGEPFAGKIEHTERPDNILEMAADMSVASLANGPHTLEVTGRDRAGNRSTRSILFFLRSLDAAIVGWGTYVNLARLGNQASLPPRLQNVTYISAGGTHCMALRSDGTVTSWGNLRVGHWDDGALATPHDLGGVVAISASCHSTVTPPHEHSIVLRSDGPVIGWGCDDDGQASPPSLLTGVVAISAGSDFSLALKGDGTVVGWGNSSNPGATLPPGVANVAAISAGYLHSLALKADGTVVGWGGTWSGKAAPPAGLANVVAISAGGNHSLALKSDGTVVGWGNNNYGQATPPAGFSDVVAVSAGYWHSLALRSDGTVLGWGFDWGAATPPAGLTNVVAISAGYQYSLALRDITPPTIDVQAPLDAHSYHNTEAAVPVAFSVKDDFDSQPVVTLTLDGQPFSGSEIDVAGLSFGEHELYVTAHDRFYNTSTKSVGFSVLPRPMPFNVKDLKIDWRHNEGKPRTDRLKLSGEFSLPVGFNPGDVSSDVTVAVEVGAGNSVARPVLGKAKIDWSRPRAKPCSFEIDADMDAAAADDGSGVVTVRLLLHVKSGGDLQGGQIVNCQVHRHSWEYHR